MLFQSPPSTLTGFARLPRGEGLLDSGTQRGFLKVVVSTSSLTTTIYYITHLNRRYTRGIMTMEIGGQAVIEGIMMKSPNWYTVAVRNEKGKIKLLKEKHSSVVKTRKWLNIPLLRGVVYLYEMMVLGMRSLMWSANQQVGSDEQLSNFEIVGTVGISIAMSIGMFVVAPFFVTKLITSDNGFMFNAIDAVLRLVVFLLYVWVIGYMQDVKRLFQYHGAEHKTINCYEQGKKLTVPNVKACSTMHPRCGTSFIVLVIALSAVIFTFVSAPQWWAKLGSRIILIPLIAGISYELLKLSARFKSNSAVRVAIYPGLWVQKLTTREPDNKQIEVAITAVKAALAEEKLAKPSTV